MYHHPESAGADANSALGAGDEAPDRPVISELAVLERKVFRLQVGGMIALGLLLAVSVLHVVTLRRTASTVQQLSMLARPAWLPLGEGVQSRGFVVVDEDGRARAVLAVGIDGHPALVMSDTHGNIVWRAP